MTEQTGDDRAAFDASRRALARDMAADRELASEALRLVEWSDRYGYSYQWSWLGLPIIQMPPDIVAVQEIIWESRPDLIIETGVARGGSLLLSATVLRVLGEGHVIGIDIDIRPHNRNAIETHPLGSLITLIEGSSIDAAVIGEVATEARRAKRVMVILDSNHTHDHVLRELEIYAPMVTPGQHLVVADTVVEQLAPQVHRPRPWGPSNNPATALAEWRPAHPEFEVSTAVENKLLLTSSPGGYLIRRQEVG
ncbi:MAG TPA: CmcI family methyltransferase [Acidimicrobiales bacterium]|nr:CmcI family methyltransferase [Acidimicrobiales bacterium]